jgi:aminotransferase
VRYDPASEIVITAGVSEALQLAVHVALDHDDELLAHEPCFVAYQPCVTLAGGVFVPAPTEPENDFLVRAADFESRLDCAQGRPSGSPNNPTGAE